jgi:hypothetical protein
MRRPWNWKWFKRHCLMHSCAFGMLSNEVHLCNYIIEIQLARVWYV